MRTALLVAAALCPLLAAGACSRKAEETSAPQASTEEGASLFSDAFSFTCSPVRAVGCEGVFEVRRGAGDFPTHAAVLWSGEDALRARLRLLEGAKRSIRIQALIFRGDEAGLAISEVLKKKRAEGVEVRVIVDALSNLDPPTQWMYFDLKQHGIEVEGYETLYLNFLTADLRKDDPLRPNKRFHDKMLIVDAEALGDAAAIVGGLNIANEYFRVADTHVARWRDQDVLLTGAIVKDVTRAFDRNYDYFKGLKERLPRIFNPDNSWRLTRAVLSRVKRVRLPDWKKSHLVALIDGMAKEAPRIEPRAVTARFLQSRPRLSETYISQAYLKLIAGARERIVIVNAYFVPSRTLLDALKDAARRGVHVQVLTNSPETNDIAPVATLSRFVYADLLAVNEEIAAGEAGRGKLEVFEWLGQPHDEGTLHAKMALFDDDVAIIGSYNLDPRSERLNSETAVAIQDRETVRQLLGQFEGSDLEKSRRIELAEARSFRRPDEASEVFELLFALPMKGWL